MSNGIWAMIALNYVQLLVVTIAMIVIYRKAGFSWQMSMIPLLLPAGSALNTYFVYMTSSFEVGSFVGLIFFVTPFLVLALSAWQGTRSSAVSSEVFK